MSFKTFIDDLRKIEVPDDFEGGNDKQRVKLNGGLACQREVVAAAEREAGETGSEKEIHIIDGGESIPQTFLVADGGEAEA